MINRKSCKYVQGEKVVWLETDNFGRVYFVLTNNSNKQNFKLHCLHPDQTFEYLTDIDLTPGSDLKKRLVKSKDSKRLWVANSNSQFTLFQICEEFVDFEYIYTNDMKNYSHYIYFRKKAENRDPRELVLFLTSEGGYLLQEIVEKKFVLRRKGILDLNADTEIISINLTNEAKTLIVSTKNKMKKEKNISSQTLFIFNMANPTNIILVTKSELKLQNMTKSLSKENILLIYPAEFKNKIIIYILTTQARLGILEISLDGKSRQVLDFTPIYREYDFKSTFFYNFSLDYSRKYFQDF